MKMILGVLFGLISTSLFANETCHTSANGKIFDVESLSKKVAKQIAIEQCKKGQGHLVEIQCEKNVYCDGDALPVTKSCTTYFAPVVELPNTQLESTVITKEYGLKTYAVTAEESIAATLAKESCLSNGMNNQCTENLICEGDLKVQEYTCMVDLSVGEGFKTVGRDLGSVVNRLYGNCSTTSWASASECRENMICRDNAGKEMSITNYFKSISLNGGGLISLDPKNTGTAFGGEIGISVDLSKAFLQNESFNRAEGKFSLVVDSSGMVRLLGTSAEWAIGGRNGLLIKPIRIKVTEASGEASLLFFGYNIVTNDGEFTVAISPLTIFNQLNTENWGYGNTVDVGGKLRLGGLELSAKTSGTVLWALGGGQIKSETKTTYASGSPTKTTTVMADGTLVEVEVGTVTTTKTTTGHETKLVLPGFKIDGNLTLSFDINSTVSIYGGVDYNLEMYQLQTKYPATNYVQDPLDFYYSVKPVVGFSLKF